MASYRLSSLADAKMVEIYRYSVRNFGLAQAQEYTRSMHHSFDLLAQRPLLGRQWRSWRRHEHAEHVIFYEITDEGIYIVRIFHHRENIVAWMKS
jgi:toxin ParE1/3/4